jgi:hypothetical protein
MQVFNPPYSGRGVETFLVLDFSYKIKVVLSTRPTPGGVLKQISTAP